MSQLSKYRPLYSIILLLAPYTYLLFKDGAFLESAGNKQALLLGLLSFFALISVTLNLLKLYQNFSSR